MPNLENAILPQASSLKPSSPLTDKLLVAMQVLLDDMPCEVDAQTVGEAIDAASVLARGRGRLITDVSVDGRLWTDVELSSPQHMTAVADSIRLVSAEPTELVRQTFAEAEEALDEADHLQREAARLLQSDQHTVAMDALGEAISIWISVQAAIVKGARVLQLDLDGMETRTPINESIRLLNERLRFVRDALAAQDLIGLSDTLLYEFPQVVEEWRGILADLQRSISKIHH